MAKWLNASITANERFNERLTALRFEVDIDRFVAGQFLRVGLEIDGEIIARPYSLVNAPDERPFEIYFNIVPEGPLSPRLFELQQGDTLLVSPMPNGFLTVNEVPETRDLWMIATGTGVGPYLSMLKTTEIWERFEHVVLAYSVRSEEELAYRPLIAGLTSKHPDQFVFAPHVTRETVDGTLPERIPRSLANGTLESFTGLELVPERSHVMMCGSADMIADVSRELESRGMQRHRRREPGPCVALDRAAHGNATLVRDIH